MKTPELKDDDQSAHWDLYPAFMEYMHEYLYYLDYMIGQQ